MLFFKTDKSKQKRRYCEPKYRESFELGNTLVRKTVAVWVKHFSSHRTRYMFLFCIMPVSKFWYISVKPTLSALQSQSTSHQEVKNARAEVYSINIICTMTPVNHNPSLVVPEIWTQDLCNPCLSYLSHTTATGQGPDTCMSLKVTKSNHSSHLYWHVFHASLVLCQIYISKCMFCAIWPLLCWCDVNSDQAKPDLT